MAGIRRLTASAAVALVAGVLVVVGLVGSPASAASCGTGPNGEVAKTKSEPYGDSGLTIGVTYNYSLCKGIGFVKNSNTNGLGQAKIDLYRYIRSSCPSKSDASYNNSTTRIATWSGTIAGKTQKVISADFQGHPSCYRVYLSIGGAITSVVQIYAQ